MTRKLKSLLGLLTLIAVVAIALNYSNRNGATPPPNAPTEEQIRDNSSGYGKTTFDRKSQTRDDRNQDYSAEKNKGFATREKYVEHFRKHGAEFGTISMEEYLHQAQALRDKPAGGDILENVRTDGVVARYERSTRTFLAFNADKTIRTYFRPNDGEAYFHRQTRREQR